MADVKWIKITTDIFDDEKILLIEAMPDADALIVIWFKLLCLAGKQNNSGVFMMNNRIAYTDEMLSTIFRRPKSTIRLALSTFESFGMIDMIDGIITIPNWEKHQSLDAYEQKKERDRIYQAERRAKQKQLAEKSSDSQTTESSDIEKNRFLDKEEEKEKEEDKNKKKTSVYFPDNLDVEEAFRNYIQMRKEIKAKMTDKAIELAVKKLIDYSSEKGSFDEAVAIQILNNSIMNSWKGLFPLKKDAKPNQANFTERSDVYNDELQKRLLLGN